MIVELDVLLSTVAVHVYRFLKDLRLLFFVSDFSHIITGFCTSIPAANAEFIPPLFLPRFLLEGFHLWNPYLTLAFVLL